MKPMKVVLCSYSCGIGNGIAHADETLLDGVDASRFTLHPFVLRADLAPGERQQQGRWTHISLATAFYELCREMQGAHIVQVNGAFDPVACNAAAAVGVPGIIEVMHQVEPGGLHEAVDVVVCFSKLVQSVQCAPTTHVIYNGVDTDRFSFVQGRRDGSRVHVVQVANAAKVLHYELAEIAAQVPAPAITSCMVGSRAALPGAQWIGEQQDMPRVYHAADLLFLVEKKAAFGLVFAEAMACGALPIVSSDSGAKELVQQGETGWVVPPGNEALAVHALQEAAQAVASPLFCAMQQKARQCVEQRFSSTRMQKDYAALWQELSRRPQRKPQQPNAWMPLTVALLLRNINMPLALQALMKFTADARPLERSFMQHPMGQGALSVLLTEVMPQLASLGRNDLVKALCSKLRQSRCYTPVLDAMERTAAGVGR